MRRSSRTRASSGVAHGIGSTRCATPHHLDHPAPLLGRREVGCGRAAAATSWTCRRTGPPRPGRGTGTRPGRPAGRRRGCACGARPAGPGRSRWQVLEVRDAQRGQPPAARAGTSTVACASGERAVVGRHCRVEQGGERRELVVRRLVAGDHAGARAGRCRATLLPGQACPVRAARGLEEADVERRRCARRARRHGRTPGSWAATSSIGRRADGAWSSVMPVSTWMNGGTGPPGSHQGLELAQHLAAPNLDRPDLRDRASPRACRRWSRGPRRRTSRPRAGCRDRPALAACGRASGPGVASAQTGRRRRTDDMADATDGHRHEPCCRTAEPVGTYGCSG